MKIYLIDIDGTICDDIKNEDSHLYERAKPIKGSVNKINDLYDRGNSINFFTARLEKDRKVTEKWLNEHGYKYHSLIMNKPRCLNSTDEYVWIDNRMISSIVYNFNW